MTTDSSILAWRIPWTEEPAIVHRIAESDTSEQLSPAAQCGGLVLKNPPASAGDAGDMGLIEVGEILWEKERQPTPVLLPGESHRQRSLKGDGP